jgi:predicted RNA-binding protein YlqC (UPF0109 family)
MKELVTYLATHLVDDVDQVRVVQKGNSRSLILELTVAPEDMGRVIGKNGRVANAIRTLVNVAAARQGKRVVLEIVDQDGTYHR